MNNDLLPSSANVSPLKFFVLTFALSWAIWIPLVLSHYAIGPFPVLEGTSGFIRLIGVLMPAVAGIILTSRSGGRHTVSALLRRLGIWQVGWKWWAAATLVYPLILVSTAVIYNFFNGSPPVTFVPPKSSSIFLVNIIFLLIATLGEEIGWRGVGLPALQQRKNALVSSIILGLCWGIWHLPFWLLQDSIDQFGVAYLVLDFLLLPITFYITWLYNHTRESLLIPVVFHLTFNIVNTALLPVTGNLGAFALFNVFNWIITLLIIRDIEPPQISQAANGQLETV
jgi:membrane protease YdiL (CAAX protease family)